MMMALGFFVFSLHTAAYQEMQRQLAWRHASLARVGDRPASQYIGKDDETITLNGVLLPQLAGTQFSLDVLHLMADTGDAWPLIQGTGRIYGLYVIESLQTTRTVFGSDGSARRIEFSISCKRVADTGLELASVLGELLLGQIR
jgi:phage protein U